MVEDLWLIVTGAGIGILVLSLVVMWQASRTRRWTIRIVATTGARETSGTPAADAASVCALPGCEESISPDRLRRWPWIRTCSPGHATRLARLQRRRGRGG
ncbi:MAG: hypothetical protein OXG13_12275 [Gemmatimonadaceae bacterium]|nr:hypothetical protein [Gemmatimonadaceae bacterium]